METELCKACGTSVCRFAAVAVPELAARADDGDALAQRHLVAYRSWSGGWAGAVVVPGGVQVVAGSRFVVPAPLVPVAPFLIRNVSTGV